MYALIAEDLSHLGGPMGTEYTKTMWTKYFNSAENAKAYAEKHFGKNITWRGDSELFSGDLGWVWYIIKEVRTED